MGTLLTYQCNKCGYSTLISGKHDAGMRIITNTFLCKKCENVVDVIVGYREGLKPDKSAIGKCPKCRSGQNLKRWNNNKRPCPKCNGTMKIKPDGEMIMFD